MDYQCTAIVLRTYRLNESDKILHLYSKEHGPIQCIAKGAYRVNSKFSAKVQVLNCLDLLLASGRNLDIVKEARLVKALPYINSNYEALTLACFAIEVLAHVAINDDSYETLFNLITNYLNELESQQSSKVKGDLQQTFSITCKYLWQLICILGYKPDLDTCSISNNKRSSNQIPQYFDLENGAVTSTSAYKNLVLRNPYQDSIRELKPGVFNTLLQFENNNEAGLESIEHTLKFLHKHLEYRIHKEFKSWKLVEQILNPSLSIVKVA